MPTSLSNYTAYNTDGLELLREADNVVKANLFSCGTCCQWLRTYMLQTVGNYREMYQCVTTEFRGAR